MSLLLLLLPLLFGAPELAAQGFDEGEGTCVTCHEAEVDEALALPVPEWRDSVHATHLVSCDACHGGDPRLEDGDESMSEEAGFLDTPSWTEMADHCGVCHEEIAASFTVGRFGRGIEAGVRVATCATCHMQQGHRIVAARPEEVRTAETCPGCPSVSDPDRCEELLRSASAIEAELRAAIASVESKGIELADFRVGVGRVHDTFMQAVHEFDDEGIDAARALAVTQYEGLREQVADLDQEADGRRRFGGGMLLALALLFCALYSSLRDPN
jgi:hypothetical protein